MKPFVLLLILVSTILADDDTRTYYVVRTAEASPFAITVQHPASGARKLRFSGAYAKCTVANVVTLEKNGTAATTTAISATALDDRGSASTSSVFASSNVGAGTLVIRQSVVANEAANMSASGLLLAPNPGTQKNFTLKGTGGGTCDVYLQYAEP